MRTMSEVAGPDQNGAGKWEPYCANLSGRDGRGLIIGGPPGVRSSETWTRGMRPAEGNRWFPQRVKDELTDEGEKGSSFG